MLANPLGFKVACFLWNLYHNLIFKIERIIYASPRLTQNCIIQIIRILRSLRWKTYCLSTVLTFFFSLFEGAWTWSTKLKWNFFAFCGGWVLFHSLLLNFGALLYWPFRTLFRRCIALRDILTFLFNFVNTFYNVILHVMLMIPEKYIWLQLFLYVSEFFHQGKFTTYLFLFACMNIYITGWCMQMYIQ